MSDELSLVLCLAAIYLLHCMTWVREHTLLLTVRFLFFREDSHAATP